MTNTVKVTNISSKATERDLWDFFAFSGEVQNVVVQPSDDPAVQTAYVTFTEEKALDTALLLTGAVIVDRPVTVEAALGYQPQSQAPFSGVQAAKQKDSTSVSYAEDVVANLLAKGYILSKDAASKAKSFDEKHQFSKTAAERAAALTGTAATTAATLDRKIGISQKFQTGVTVVNDSWKTVDQKYGVVEKSRAAFTTAEQTVNQAASALMKNQYVASGTTWLTGAFGKVVKVAEDVQTKTKEKVQEQESGKTDGPSAGNRPPSLSHPDLTLPPEPPLAQPAAAGPGVATEQPK